MTDLFQFFYSHEWLYDSQKIMNVYGKLSETEQVEFDCNIKGYDWTEYLDRYIRGLLIWVLREDTVAPAHDMYQIALKNGPMGIHWQRVSSH